jgi:hypothetical protein
MNFKSGSLFFLVTAILMTMALLMFASAPNYIMRGKKTKSIKPKKHKKHKKHHILKKKPYFDRDVLRINQNRWRPNYHLPDVNNRLGQFLPHRRRSALI